MTIELVAARAMAARQAAIVVVVTALVANSTEAHAQRRTSALPRTPLACGAHSIGETPLVVEGRAAYVEPQAFVKSGEWVLLAGTPAYMFGRTREPALIRRDSVIGVVIDASGRTMALRPPIAGSRVHDVRAAPAKPGKWAVMFAEAEPLPRPQDDARVAAYWFGLTDGARWSRLVRAPVTGGSVRSIAASALVRTARGFALAVPFDSGSSGDQRGSSLVIEWNGHRLTTEVAETGWAAYVALAADHASTAGHLLLGVVQPDIATDTSDEGSLIIYRRETTARAWRRVGRLVRGLGQTVHDPFIDVTRSAVVVTWRAEVPGGSEARAIVAESLGGVPPPPMTLGTGITQVASIPADSAPVWVIVTPADGTNSVVRVVARTKGRPATIVEAASPFHRPIAAVWADGRLLLTSGVPSRLAGAPPVQSRILSVQCAVDWRRPAPP